jgi:hypothetical protein
VEQLPELRDLDRISGFSFTVARPLFKLTSTDSTPGTFFNATSTTWAQVIQSMPKIDRST